HHRKRRLAVLRQAARLIQRSDLKSTRRSQRNETPAAPGRFATFQYQFRLVDPSDPPARSGGILTKQPDVLIETRSRSSADGNVRPQNQPTGDLLTGVSTLD